MPQVVPTIFKPYGLSGQYPGELNEGAAYVLGRGFAELIKARAVVIGRDARSHSETLANSFARGLVEQGVEVHDIGLASTPYLHFACQQADYDGSVMVTGAHLASDQNGFILTKARAEPLTDEHGLVELRELVHAGIPSRSVQPGRRLTKDYSTIYLDAITRNRTIAGLTLAIDTGNGMAGFTLPAILQRLPQVAVLPLNMEINSLFPGRGPDVANPEALIKLKGAMRLNKCDLGVAFDGDGSRIVFITAQGEQLTTDQAATLFARQMLLGRPGEPILHDAWSSQVVPEEVRAAGGRPVAVRAQPASVYRALREQHALFAADTRGHYYFKDFYGVANADCALLAMLEIITQARHPLQALIAPLKRYVQSGDLQFAVDDPHKALERVRRNYPRAQHDTTDGLSLHEVDWHLHCRVADDLQSLLVRLETRTPESMRQKRNELNQLFLSLIVA